MLGWAVVRGDSGGHAVDRFSGGLDSTVLVHALRGVGGAKAQTPPLPCVGVSPLGVRAWFLASGLPCAEGRWRSWCGKTAPALIAGLVCTSPRAYPCSAKWIRPPGFPWRTAQAGKRRGRIRTRPRCAPTVCSPSPKPATATPAAWCCASPARTPRCCRARGRRALGDDWRVDAGDALFGQLRDAFGENAPAVGIRLMVAGYGLRVTRRRPVSSGLYRCGCASAINRATAAGGLP